jgi:hypothetical protein
VFVRLITLQSRPNSKLQVHLRQFETEPIAVRIDRSAVRLVGRARLGSISWHGRLAHAFLRMGEAPMPR